MGMKGKIFTFLKFRSTYTNSYHSLYRNYVKIFSGKKKSGAGTPGVYKLSNDPRFKPIGHFLRKTASMRTRSTLMN